MAIDEKFVTAGISKDVVSQINKPRRKKRKRPKPWDSPTPKNNSVSNEINSEQAESLATSEAQESSVSVADFNPAVIMESPLINKVAKPKASEDNDSSDSREQLIKSTRTVRELSANSTKTESEHRANNKRTVLKQKANTKQTVGKQIRNSTPTVHEQNVNSTPTVHEQTGNSANTVREQNANSSPIVHEQYGDNTNTVDEQYNNSLSTVHEQSENSEQTVRKKNKNSTQTDSKQYTNSTGNNSTTVRELFANRNLTGEISIGESIEIIRSLNGTRLQIIEFVCNECIKNSINVLPKISYPFIANMLGKKKDSLRTIFARVKKLGIIDIEAKVKGPGSTVDIIVFENTVKAFSQFILEQNNYQKISQQYANSTGTGSRTLASSSNSIPFIEEKNTTTTNEEFIFPEEFLEIQIPSAVNAIGFRKHHIEQVAKKGILTAEDLKDSLHHFEFDLSNEKGRSWNDPLSVLMAQLIKKGHPYTSGPYMKSLQAEREASEKELAEYREYKKQIAEDELMKKFEDYRKSLTQEQINELVPPNNFIKEGSRFQELALREVFEKK